MGRIRQVTSLIKLATADAPLEPAPSSAPAMNIAAPVAAVTDPVKRVTTTATGTTYPMAKQATLSLVNKKPVIATAAPAKTSAETKKVAAVMTPAGKTGAVTSATATPTPTASTKAAVTAGGKTLPTTPSVATNAKKTKKVAQGSTKSKHNRQVASNNAHDNLTPPPDQAYLRAKPVDAADLVAAPSVMSTPPPARSPNVAPVPETPVAPAAETEGADPNSLGAQLNPFHSGGTQPTPLAPHFSGASLDETQTSVTSPLGGVTGKANDAAP
jgi:hypothetical protein